MIKKLSANLGGTNIEGPLKYIYDSNDKYEKFIEYLKYSHL